jgi:hypothetical protein
LYGKSGPQFPAISQTRQELCSKFPAYAVVDRRAFPAPLNQACFIQYFQVLTGHGLGKPDMILYSRNGLFATLGEVQNLKPGRVTQDFQ